MKLYTINATPWRDDLQRSANMVRMVDYPEQVAKLLSTFNINGFTIYEVQGYWMGKSERSFKIELALENGNDVKAICGWLRDNYNQDAVMLTNPDNTVEFI